MVNESSLWFVLHHQRGCCNMKYPCETTLYLTLRSFITYFTFFTFWHFTQHNSKNLCSLNVGMFELWRDILYFNKLTYCGHVHSTNLEYKPCLRGHFHQQGEGPPTGAGSAFRSGRVFTLVQVPAQFQFVAVPFRGTVSLIYQYRPTSAPYSCVSRRRIAPWAILRAPAAGPRRRHSGHAAV